MSKFLADYNRLKAAFDSIDFDAKSLEADPEALQTYLSRQTTDGIEDLKTQIATLKDENATLKADLEAATSSDIEAADELLAETQANLEKAEEELATLKETAGLQEAAYKVKVARLAAFAAAFDDVGIQLEPAADGSIHNAETISEAITHKIQVATSEKLAAHGFKGLIEDEHTLAADSHSSDPYAGMTGIQQAAAALKARNASR